MVQPPITRPPVEIDPDGDCVVKVCNVKKRDGSRRFITFKVSHEALMNSCGPNGYFRKSNAFNEANGHAGLRLEDNHCGAMHIWFLYMHYDHAKGTNDDWSDQTSAIEEGDAIEQDNFFIKHAFKSVSVNVIWHIINMGDKYLFDGAILKGFFKRWYALNKDLDEKGIDFARSLALPCYVFDHAEGFAEVTKWLAYNAVGHITETRPDGFKWKHIHLAPPDFVGPKNAARGRLRTVLDSKLWSRTEMLMEQGQNSISCTRWKFTFATYFHALWAVDVWPLELNWPKNSVKDILGRLDEVSCSRLGCCTVCTVNWEPVVEHAVRVTKGYFDGLCIDCMDRSRLPPGVDPDDTYWEGNEAKDGRWDSRCRIRHGEPSWYHSWLGRSEHRQKLVKQKDTSEERG